MTQYPESKGRESRQFQTLADQMQAAMDKGDAVEFSSLVRKRSKLIHRLVEAGDPSQLPSGLLTKLTEENRQWIGAAQRFLTHTQAEIDKIKPMKTATRQLANAYSGRNAEAGSLLSRKG